jgi:hypothetical protein
MGSTVRGSNPGRGNIFVFSKTVLRDPPSLLLNAYGKIHTHVRIRRIKFSLYLVKHHAIKTNGGKGMAPGILNRGTRSVVGFTSQLIYLHNSRRCGEWWISCPGCNILGEGPRCPSNRRHGAHHSRCRHVCAGLLGLTGRSRCTTASTVAAASPCSNVHRSMSVLLLRNREGRICFSCFYCISFW